MPHPSPALRPAVFLDRDGTLMEEVDYCRDPEKVRLLPGVAAGLRRLQAAGYILIIVTNQSGLGRGLIQPAEYEAVQARLLSLLPEGTITATYFCPEAPWEATERRKPGAGMVREAVRDWGLDPARSWFIGDKGSDARCGLAAGVRSILVQTGYGAGEEVPAGTLVAPDFTAAAGLITDRAPAEENGHCAPPGPREE